MKLTFTNHDRDQSEMKYVYAVLSRRARGVSIGINLNPDNACNWRCVYCQVPGLTYGLAPTIDPARLEEELERMLDAVLEGDLLRDVPEEYRRLNDVAFSGNGEPTTSEQFGAAADLARRALEKRSLQASVKLLLITNGSMTHRPDVQDGLRAMARGNAEVWFKIDRGTREGRRQVNSVGLDSERVLDNLSRAAELCPTWIQTCMFLRNGEPPSDEEVEAYLDLIRASRERGLPVRGVHLYGLARVSHQPEAPELAPLPEDWLRQLAERIEAAGLECRIA